MTRRTKLAYLTLCTAIICSRAAYVVHDGTFRSVSGAEMERAAASVARSGTIANVYSDDSGPSAHVAPLYPLWLGGLYAVFGWNTQAGRIAQEAGSILVTTASIALLPVAARIAGLSAAAGWAAAVLLAVLPLNLWIESSGSWEQPYAALALTLLVLAFCRLAQEGWGSKSRTILTGTGVGLVALLTPALLPAPALMTLVQACRHRRKALRSAGLLMAAAGVVVAPWVLRNALLFGAFIPLRSNFGLELALGNNPVATGKTFVTAFDDPKSPTYSMHPLTSSDERRHLAELGEWRYMLDKQRTALEWIRSHPGRFATLTARRFRLFWFPPADLWSPNSPGRTLKALFGTATAALAFACILVLIRNGKTEGWLAAGALLGSSIVYVITHIDPRLRYPIVPLTTLLAAHACLVGADCLMKRANRLSASYSRARTPFT